MSSPELSPTLLERVKMAAVSRWKLETLTGLLGIRSLQAHQHQSELNQRAENEHVRRSVWGFDEKANQGDDMQSQTILGDHHITHPAPIVIAGQQAGSGLGKAMVGLAIGALIPTAGVGGYLASQLLKPSGPAVPVPAVEPVKSETVNLGLLRLEDLEGNEQ